MKEAKQNFENMSEVNKCKLLLELEVQGILE